MLLAKYGMKEDRVGHILLSCNINTTRIYATCTIALLSLYMYGTST